MLPHTNAGRARIALEKARDAVYAEMQANQWPVTLSIGAVAAADGRADPEALLHAADEQMYRVKNGGRDGFLIQDFAPAVLNDSA